MFRVQLIPSFRCNLYDQQQAAPHGRNCPYCWLYSPMSLLDSYVTFNGIRKPIARELTPDEWIKGAHKVINAAQKPILFDITGGEPMLYKGLPEVLAKLKHLCAWAITSNSLLRRQIDAIFASNADRPISWTGSWHPGSGRPLDEFLANLDFIRSNHCPVSVTTVLHDSTKHRIKADIQRIREAGFLAQIHLYMNEGYAVTDDSQELQRLYTELKDDNRSPAEYWNDSPVSPRSCTAGQESATVAPDGSVYLCFEHCSIESAPKIGEWGTWTPSKEPTRNCTWTCRFPCDQSLILSKESQKVA